MMGIKLFLPIYDLTQYSILKQCDAVEKMKKGQPRVIWGSKYGRSLAWLGIAE
jgi:hypothetical protein